MSELKPCPFCGGKAEIVEDSGHYRVMCLLVDCNVNPIGNYRDTEQEAIEAWNTRTERIVPILNCSDCSKLNECLNLKENDGVEEWTSCYHYTPNELKHCPFCNSSRLEVSEDGTYAAFVTCLECGCLQDLTEWNRRAK